MARAGRAWRGWFPVGGELTSGTPDRKEGLYFGEELPADDPRVVAGRPLHGANLFPIRPAGLRETVLAIPRRVHTARSPADGRIRTGARARRGLVRPRADDGPGDPLPDVPLPGAARRRGRRSGLGGGGAHRLRPAHDPVPGRGRRARGARPRRLGRDPAPPGCAGLQPRRHARAHDRRASTARPHTASAAPRGRDRIACPFFFDPGWDAEVRAITRARRPTLRRRRQPGGTAPASTSFSGTYGDYLLGKVSKVFPDPHGLRPGALTNSFRGVYPSPERR